MRGPALADGRVGGMRSYTFRPTPGKVADFIFPRQSARKTN